MEPADQGPSSSQEPVPKVPKAYIRRQLAYILPDTPPSSADGPTIQEILDSPESPPPEEGGNPRVIPPNQWRQTTPRRIIAAEVLKQEINFAAPPHLKDNGTRQPNVSVKMVPTPEEILQDIRMEYESTGPVLTNILLNYTVKGGPEWEMYTQTKQN